MGYPHSLAVNRFDAAGCQFSTSSPNACWVVTSSFIWDRGSCRLFFDNNNNKRPSSGLVLCLAEKLTRMACCPILVRESSIKKKQHSFLIRKKSLLLKLGKS